MKIKMEEIRKVILKHHGGLQEATDAQIKVVWNSLPKDVQERYLLENKQEGKVKDAVSDKSKSDIRSRS